MNNKRKIKIILRNRVILFVLLLVIISNLSAILTYIYIAKTIYPAIAFLLSIILVYLVCRSNLQQSVDLYTTENKIFISDTYYFLSDLQYYSFNETNYIGTITLSFINRKVKLSLLRNKNLEYQKLKDDILKLIDTHNKQNNKKIKEFDWYFTKSAKIYGYITAFIMILWIAIMLMHPEKLKLSNLGLFLIVSAGISPILLRIFGNNKSV
ncbi:ABC-type multidrug transport system fused ATPase/permease subunit [Chryseobacterium sediminis]|uniref:ABC-type multidrug transport system fused ATPase/permease subunit n=1 Tax=Chryseobacterium sediminis TaxID=1679494 RepID=A0ABR6PZ58_9FLAO|nr:hypothetical protein [Chryseobacterium sediminis]MBB6330332.1 ABC-type multidrug transport system fused ATPase/permease subunit [Chryseobacterium sediminis]